MAINFKDFQKLKWFYQVVIVAGICGGLLGLFWYEYLAPMQISITDKTKQLGDLQKIVADYMRKQKDLEKIKKEAQQLQAELDELKKILPLEKETDQVLRSVQASASTSELRILRVGFRPIVDREVYTEWPIDMEVVGTYHNMGAFLDKIRQLPRIVNISALKIQGRTSGDQVFRTTVGATYTATTFVYREEEPVNSAPPASPVK